MSRHTHTHLEPNNLLVTRLLLPPKSSTQWRWGTFVSLTQRGEISREEQMELTREHERWIGLRQKKKKNESEGEGKTKATEDIPQQIIANVTHSRESQLTTRNPGSKLCYFPWLTTHCFCGLWNLRKCARENTDYPKVKQRPKLLVPNSALLTSQARCSELVTKSTWTTDMTHIYSAKVDGDKSAHTHI